MSRAVSRGDAAAVAALLDKGEDLNERIGREEMTPLKLAVWRHRPEIARLLLERGADVNIRRNGTSALSLAVIGDDAAMVELLLAKGAEVTERERKWALGPHRAEILALLARAAPAPKAPVAPAYEPTAGVDEPSYKMGERPDDFAVVVSVERPMDGPETRFAGSDADAMRRHLIAMGWPSRNIITLADKAAGRAGLSKYLERWLPNNVTENSRLFFYFAGAGAADSSGQAYLLPWDGDPAQLEATGYPLSRLYEKLNALKVRSVLAVLDAGFSGAGPRTGGKQAGTQKRVDFDAKDQGGVVVLCAASGSETIGLQEDERHGALTYFLLKGLNGPAADANGIVTVKGLFGYVRRQIGAQTPQLLTGNLGESDLRLR